MEDQLAGVTTKHVKRSSANGVMVEGDPDLWVKLAKCCTPVPGDEIIGFITRERGVSVHRKNCTNAADLLNQPDRIVAVDWAPTSYTSGFLVTIQIECLDRSGLLSDVTRLVSDQGGSITAANVHTSKNRTAKIRLTFEGSDSDHLAHLVETLRKVSGVYDVYRVKQ